MPNKKFQVIWIFKIFSKLHEAIEAEVKSLKYKT